MAQERKGDILLVEDNLEILRANCVALEMEGFQVRTAETLHAAKQAVSERAPQVIVLDVLLPDGSGLDFCREIYAELGIPILFLSALDDKSDIVAGLRAGGCDYLTKPYDLDELIARIEAMLRFRSRAARGVTESLGPLTLQTQTHTARLNDEQIPLKPMELRLLWLLMERRGGYTSAKTLYQLAWGDQPIADLRTVYVHIAGLRKKLGLDENSQSALVLLCEKSLGYRLTMRGET